MSETPKKKWGPFKIGCLGVLCIVGLGALWLLYALYWSFTVEPGGGNAAARRLDELIAANQPKDQDGRAGFQSLLEAITLYAAEEAAFRTDFPGDAQPENWPSTVMFPYDFDVFLSDGVPEVSKSNTKDFLQRLQRGGLPKALGDVAAQPAFARPIFEKIGDQSLIGLLLPELGKIRALCRYNSARINLAASQGNEKALVEAFDSTLALSRASASDPITISKLVAIAVFAKGSGDLRTALTEHRCTPETIEALIASLDRQTQWPPFEGAIEGERAIAQDCIQRTFSDDGEGDGRMIVSVVSTMLNDSAGQGNGVGGLPAELSKTKFANVIGFFSPSKKETLAASDAIFDSWISHIRLSTPARRATAGDSPQFNEAEIRKFPVLAVIMPSLGRAAQSAGIHEATLAGTRLMLAIELFRARNKSCPDSLDQLIPGFLPAAITDPFTGTPFGYIKLATPDEFGREYILYSYGSNLVDNGGAFDPKSNFLAESDTSKTQPLDWILNAPRPKYTPPE